MLADAEFFIIIPFVTGARSVLKEPALASRNPQVFEVQESRTKPVVGSTLWPEYYHKDPAMEGVRLLTLSRNHGAVCSADSLLSDSRFCDGNLILEFLIGLGPSFGASKGKRLSA